jgi:predicted DCC family thiol-disulfide oxidoreductase YuxK
MLANRLDACAGAGMFALMARSTADGPGRWIIFFDGGCGLCDRAVGLVAALDGGQRLWFAPLQGEAAKVFGVAGDVSEAGTMVLVRAEGREIVEVFERAEAALQILRVLGGAWRWLAGLLRIVPRAWRERLYRWIAKNRHRWFAPRSCALDDRRLGGRLLD